MRRVSFTDDALRREGEEENGRLMQFMNCRLLREGDLRWEDLWVENGRVLDAGQVFFEQRRMADIQIDCAGHILSPGFIDLQFNGGFGVDFSSHGAEGLTEALDMVSGRLLEYGVTAFCPTLVTSESQVYHRLLPLLKDSQCRGRRQATMLGAHLEGPFISKAKKGAHPEEHIIEDCAQLEEVYGSLEGVAMITLAPELSGAMEAIRRLTKKGIVVSIGHSSAGLVCGEEAIAAGAKMITHLFNAMQAYHHRDPGLIGLLTSKYRPPARPIYYGIIADGIHTHDSALRIAHRTHPEGLVLVTDAVSAFGMGDGHHQLGHQTIFVHGLQATVTDTNTTAGSVASMPLCIRHLIKAARCSIIEALECATSRPAQVLGLQRKGVLSIGADADFVLLDDNIRIQATFLSSRLVYTAS